MTSNNSSSTNSSTSSSSSSSTSSSSRKGKDDDDDDDDDDGVDAAVLQTAYEVKKYIDENIGDVQMVKSLADFYWSKRVKFADEEKDYEI